MIELPPEYAFLPEVKHGVIHVGANSGQERIYYAEFGLRVVWLEPIPRKFAELVSNLTDYPEQQAFRRLITDVDGGEYTLHLQRNEEQQSTSIFQFSGHKQLFPWAKHRLSLPGVHSVTLATFMACEQLNPVGYDALVIDTEGAELLVLKGAGNLLHGFDFVLVEAGDVELYAGGCTLGELDAYLGNYGFQQEYAIPFHSKPGFGFICNALYTR